MKLTPELNLGPGQKKILKAPDPEVRNNHFN
jgi:hypothetical protein